MDVCPMSPVRTRHSHSLHNQHRHLWTVKGWTEDDWGKD